MAPFIFFLLIFIPFNALIIRLTRKLNEYLMPLKWTIISSSIMVSAIAFGITSNKLSAEITIVTPFNNGRFNFEKQKRVFYFKHTDQSGEMHRFEIHKRGQYVYNLCEDDIKLVPVGYNAPISAKTYYIESGEFSLAATPDFSDNKVPDTILRQARYATNSPEVLYACMYLWQDIEVYTPRYLFPTAK